MIIRVVVLGFLALYGLYCFVFGIRVLFAGHRQKDILSILMDKITNLLLGLKQDAAAVENYNFKIAGVSFVLLGIFSLLAFFLYL